MASAWLSPSRSPSTHTHLPYEFLDSLVDVILAKVELGGHALGLVCESHAALGSGVEGALELDVLLGSGADFRLLEDERISEGQAWWGDAPMLVGLDEDFADGGR